MKDTSIHSLLQAALAHHQAGRLSQAEALYRKVLDLAPHHADVLNLLGLVFHQQGNNELAVELIEKAIKINASVPGYHSHLGAALQAQGRLEEAVESYRRALSIKPDYAAGYCNLGVVLQLQGKFDEAVRSCRQALALKPDYPEAYCNLGAALQSQGLLGEAIESFRYALLLKPDYAEAYCNLGNALKYQGQLAESAESLRHAISLKPDYAEAHNNLGNTLQTQGHLNEAIESFRKAILLKPDYAEAYSNLGYTYNCQCRSDEAVASYRQALLAKPDYAGAYNNMLFIYAYQAMLTPGNYLDLARGWERACVPARDRQIATARVFQHPPLTGRKLKIGYVSGDYRQHVVSYFIKQIFACHDRTRIELFAYSTTERHDSITDEFMSLTEHWISLAGLDDATAAALIRSDGIDVLIDLAGHTVHNRLGIFALRSAPVQAHYLGFLASTGLSEMDYWIGDDILTPPETDSHFSEQVWRLPRVWISYEGKTDVSVSDWHPDSNGIIWVGSFNRLNKLTPATLALWAKVLHALPEGRLLLKNEELAEDGNRHRILAVMESHGITSGRIELHDSKIDTPSWSSHMAYYNRLDVALDPVGGMSGGTTTCDALWMGVPLITLVGDRMASRMTASMLHAIGHPEWVARSEAEYIGKVVRLARNAELRKRLRVEQRRQMAISPMCDARNLTAELEHAYFAMYQRWSDMKELT